MVIPKRVSITTSSSAQVPRARVSLSKSISGWWTRWLERKVVAPIARSRKPAMASRPRKVYFPPL